jgi:hypothetical protein
MKTCHIVPSSKDGKEGESMHWVIPIDGLMTIPPYDQFTQVLTMAHMDIASHGLSTRKPLCEATLWISWTCPNLTTLNKPQTNPKTDPTKRESK